MPALTAEGVTAGYGRVPVIRDISLVAEAGQITAVIGPNGAGKSTLAKTLTGVLRTTTGRIVVNGKDVTRMPGHLLPRQGLAYVPQNENIFPNLTVRENLEVGGYVRPGDTSPRIGEVLEAFPDLRVASAKKAGKLSGGQQNLLALARALMATPSVIVLDEPTAGLSPTYTDVVWSQIERITRGGTAVLVIEQNVDRAITHADAVYVLVAGANHMQGTAAQIAQIDLGAVFLGHRTTEAQTADAVSALNTKESLR